MHCMQLKQFTVATNLSISHTHLGVTDEKIFIGLKRKMHTMRLSINNEHNGFMNQIYFVFDQQIIPSPFEHVFHAAKYALWGFRYYFLQCVKSIASLKCKNIYNFHSFSPKIQCPVKYGNLSWLTYYFRIKSNYWKVSSPFPDCHLTVIVFLVFFFEVSVQLYYKIWKSLSNKVSKAVSKNQYRINYVKRWEKCSVPSVDIKLKNEWVKLENSSRYGKRILKWFARVMFLRGENIWNIERIKSNDRNVGKKGRILYSNVCELSTDEHWLILSFSSCWIYGCICSGSHVCVIYLKIHNLPPKIQ